MAERSIILACLTAEAIFCDAGGHLDICAMSCTMDTDFKQLRIEAPCRWYPKVLSCALYECRTIIYHIHTWPIPVPVSIQPHTKLM